jgi:protein-disulfide isomerase
MVMGRKPSFIHILVLATAFAAATLIAAGAVYEVSTPIVKPNAVLTDGRPRIGRLEAKIELLLIEDFRCGACQYFTQKIFPEIYEKYIETGRAYCVMVPVSFLEGSEPLANAALSVYKLAPDSFLPYLHDLMDFFSKQEVGDVQAQLLELAKNIGGIDLNRLKECIETNCFSPDLEQNLEWAKRMMGRDFGTPTFFVNGIRTSTSSVEAIEALIEKVEIKQ